MDAVVGASAVVGIVLSAFALSVRPAVAAAAEAISTVSHELIPFDHPISLEDAQTVKQVGDAAVVGFRFSSDSIVGDYWTSSSQGSAAFLNDIYSKTGTYPEVVGAYIEVELNVVWDGETFRKEDLTRAVSPHATIHFSACNHPHRSTAV